MKGQAQVEQASISDQSYYPNYRKQPLLHTYHQMPRNGVDQHQHEHSFDADNQAIIIVKTLPLSEVYVFIVLYNQVTFQLTTT